MRRIKLILRTTGVVLASIVFIYSAIFTLFWASDRCPTRVEVDDYGKKIVFEDGTRLTDMHIAQNFVCAPIIEYLENKYCDGSCLYISPTIEWKNPGAI